jgi:hypothetical protein
MNYTIPSHIIKLIESYVDEAKQVNNKRPEVPPTDLTELFTNNPETKFFKVISKEKGGDVEHNFGIELVINQKTKKPTGQATIKDLKTNCEDLRNLGTLLYGNTFGVDFGGCGKTIIKNSVMVKTYTDLNGQPLDEYPIDFEEGNPSDQRIVGYYNSMKGLKVGEYAHFDQAGTVNKYDGEVIRHDGNAMQLTMSKHGSKAEFNLNINLEQNPFYLENDNIMFKGEATTPKDFENSEDNVDRRPFVIELKRFSTTNEDIKPKKGVQKEKPSDEELKSDGKEALDMILNDPTLKAAFYTQPTFLERLKAELSGKAATGTGIKPTLDLLGKYFDKQVNEKIGDGFRDNKVALFEVKQNVVITYTEGNKNKQFKLLRGIQYNAKPREHDLKDGVTKVLREDPAGKPADPFEIIVKGKTKEPDTYLCDVYKVYVSGNQPKRIPQKNVEIKFYKSEGYTPEERKPEEPKSQFK